MVHARFASTTRSSSSLVLLMLLAWMHSVALGRNVTDFVNMTHVSIGSDVESLIPRVDAEKVVALTFQEEAPLAILFPFKDFAVTQVTRTIVTGPGGIFRVCRQNDTIEDTCLRPGAVYEQSQQGRGEEFRIGMPPIMPSNTTFTVMNATAIEISWTQPNPSGIDHYECYIYWNSNFEARANTPHPDPRLLDVLNKSVIIPADASPVTVEGLPPFSWLRVVFVTVHASGVYGFQSTLLTTRAASLAAQKPVLVTARDGNVPPIATVMAIVTFTPNLYPDVLSTGEVEIVNNVTKVTTTQRFPIVEATFQGQVLIGGRAIGLEPFTPYTFRLRLIGNHSRTATQFSDPVSMSTPPTLQPAMAFEESKENTDPQQFVNITWVSQPKNDQNITIRLRTFNADGAVVDVIDCTTCTYWLFSAPDVRADKIRFIAGQAINSIGNSSGSGLFRLRTQDRVSDSSSHTLTIALATVLPIVLALAIMTAVLYRRWRTRYVYQVLKFPEPDEWEIPRDKVVVDFRNELGHGAFGIVFGGHLLVDVDDDLAAGAPVAIKTLRNEASDERKMELIEEAGRMKRLGRHTHPNVIQLYGVCLQAQPLLVIMEYAPHGTLRAYASENSLSTGQQVRAVLDVARGMAYLAEHDFVHRDLAARNCMVGAGYVVKVADFGLARDIHYLHYYRKTGSAVLPVRWMAPECMVEGKFDAETDVWSYGVVVWEVFSQGRLPYEEMTNDQVYEAVIRGLRLQPPKDMPPFMGEVLKSCFALQRPSFASLAHVLQRYCIDNNYQAVGESGDCGGNFSTRATPQPRGGTPPSAKGFDESVV